MGFISPASSEVPDATTCSNSNQIIVCVALVFYDILLYGVQNGHENTSGLNEDSSSNAIDELSPRQ